MQGRLLVTTLALAAAALPATARADWPIYGHDLANTRDAGTAGPSRDQLGSLKRAWTFNSPNDFTGTPVVAGGVVVAGDYGGHVYALNAVTGKQLWSKDVGAPVVGTAAIDLRAPRGPAAFVPVAQQGGPRLVAFSLANGAKRWDTTLTTQENSSVFGSPTYSDGTLYIGTSGPNNDDTHARGSVLAIDERSGAIRWQTFTTPPGSDGAAVWTTPALDTDTGRLYVGTGNNYHDPATDTEDSMMVLDAASGAILGHFQATSGDTFAADNPLGPDADFGASPNLIEGPDGQKLVGEGQKSGDYWALDRTTMKPVWRTNVGPPGPIGGVLGSTAYDGTRIYGGDTLNGAVFALGRDGMQAWSSSDTGVLHTNPATVANGVLYNSDPGGSVIARDPATGTVLERLSLDGPALGGVSADGGALYVAVGTGPPPAPAPQQDGAGSIVAFGDTSRSGAGARPPAPAAAPHAPRRAAPLRLSVRPRRVHARRRVVLRIRVVRRGRPVSGATVRLATRRARTDSRGRTALVVRLPHRGAYVVHATQRGAPAARATVRAGG